MVQKAKVSRRSAIRPLIALGFCVLLVAAAMRWLYLTERDDLIQPEISSLEREISEVESAFYREIDDSRQDALFLSNVAAQVDLKSRLGEVEGVFAAYLQAHTEFSSACLLEPAGECRFRIGESVSQSSKNSVRAVAASLTQSGSNLAVTFAASESGKPLLRLVHHVGPFEGFVVLDLDMQSWANLLSAREFLLLEERASSRPQAHFSIPTWYAKEGNEPLESTLESPDRLVRTDQFAISAHVSLVPPEGTLFLAADGHSRVRQWHLVAKRQDILKGSTLPLMTYSMIGGLVVIVILFGILWRSQYRLNEAKQLTAERVEAERARLELIVNNMPVPVFFQNCEGVLTMVNDAFEGFLGTPSEEIVGRKIIDLLPPEEVPHFLNWDDPLVMLDEQRRSQETTLINSFKELRRVSVVVTESGVGADQTMIGAIIDNTEGVNAFEAMQDSLDLMTKVTSQVPGVVFEFKRRPDGTYCFPWASVGIQQIYEVSPLDVETSADAAFANILEEDRGRVLESLEISGQLMEPWRAEYRVARTNGESRWVLGNAVPERETDGSILWHGFVADITDVKAFEEQLREAKAEAEQANRAKSAFLAAMSHEIRTPMNGVIGMTSLLAQTELDDEQSGYVHTIRHSGDALLVVINDILDFSKIESGRLELETMPFDLAECVEGVVDILAPQAIKKGLAMAYYIDHEVPLKISGDVTRVRQILVNLVGNAIKFTTEGEVFINVDLVERVGERFVRVTVEDTGSGIPASRADRLFKPFSQVDTSTNRVYGGTGLGLAISKRLTEIMRGDLFFESTEGEGSSFFFLLPLDESAVGTRTLRFSSLVEPLAGKRVLVVDDRTLDRVVISSYLEVWGVDFVLADSRKAVSDWIDADERFDVILFDRNLMPGENDRESLSVLEKWTKAKQTRIIVMDAVGRGKRNDWDGFLPKPIKAQALCQSLRSVLLRIPSTEQSEVPIAAAEALGALRAEDLRILLAEDNRVNQRVATMILAKIGYEADITNNGREAFEACRDRAYDVVLMDIQMPEMDGLEATRAIREETGDLHQPWIIALTANATTGDRDRAIENGMNDYLAKPIKVDDLRQALNRFIARRTEMAATTDQAVG